ncbi:hypothetical protein ABW20_dc0106986 [Dactylellina cionopaga]|nr:hypothetical protein ABW20_dc0106986 [Dactylellina cionopaga]
MVGIGGGIPPEVRLGDVVVSTPVDEHPGVVQWDLGRATEGGGFQRTGVLDRPPTLLLTALTKLETSHARYGSIKIPQYLEQLKEKFPPLASKYLRHKSLKDVLFKSNCPHISESAMAWEMVAEADGEKVGEKGEDMCRLCDKKQVVLRTSRDMSVHFGLIASGNRVIKDAKFRNQLNKDLGGNVLCVEMEAAGLSNIFPCLVIRGICDYADSHKNETWQEHAAAVAAAFAKELLGYVQPEAVNIEPTVKELGIKS